MKQATIDAIKFIGKTANESPNLPEVALILIRELCNELVKDAQEDNNVDKDLTKELNIRSTAEISNGKVLQVTQSLNETTTNAEYVMFGELHNDGVIPIDEACSKCDFWKRFGAIKSCQTFQSKDARARGFNAVICPNQFVD